MRSAATALVGLFLLPACFRYRYQPPAPPTPRDARTVYASFGKTWDAVIDVFAEQNIPIRTMERASGFIAAERTSWTLASSVDRDYVLRLTDCGRMGPYPYLPSSAVYNIVVRGDSATATVKVTSTYTSRGAQYTNPTQVGPVQSLECTSKGVFEDSVEVAIKQRAEAVASHAGRIPTTPPSPPRPDALGNPAATDPRPLNVTVRMRFVERDSTVTPIPDLALTVVSERGDTTVTTRTNGLGVANLSLPLGRYRVVPLRPVDYEGKRYEWDVTFGVRMGMGPVDLTQRNARVSAVPR